MLKTVSNLNLFNILEYNQNITINLQKNIDFYFYFCQSAAQQNLSIVWNKKIVVGWYSLKWQKYIIIIFRSTF